LGGEKCYSFEVEPILEWRQLAPILMRRVLKTRRRRRRRRMKRKEKLWVCQKAFIPSD